MSNIYILSYYHDGVIAGAGYFKTEKKAFDEKMKGYREHDLKLVAQELAKYE